MPPEQNTTTTEQPADKAPEAPKAPEFSEEQKAFMNNLVQSRLKDDREKQQKKATDATAAATKTLEEQIAELNKRADAAEQNAIRAIIAKAAANTHDPAFVAKSIDIEGLTSNDADAIEARVADLLKEKAWLVKTAAGTPTPAAVTPTQGAGGGEAQPTGGSADSMSDAEFDAVTPQELAADDKLMQRYLKTVALKG